MLLIAVSIACVTIANNYETVILAVVVFLLLKYALERPKGLPPGPFGWPLVHNLSMLWRTPHVAFTELAENHGRVYSLRIGRKLVVVLNEIDVIREAFVKQGDIFAGRPELFIDLLSDEGRGVITTDGPRWQQLRKFALVSLRDFGMGKPKMEQIIMDEMPYLLSAFRTADQPFNPHAFLLTSVANIVCSVLFSKRYDYADMSFQILLQKLDMTFEYARNASPLNFAPMIRFFLPGAKTEYETIRDGISSLHSFLLEQIKERQQTFDPDHIRDITDKFLKEIHARRNADDASVFTIEELKIFLLNLFVGGTMTTFLTLRWALLYISANQSVQRQIQAEIDNVTACARLPQFKDHSQLSFTEATINEVQRCGAVVPLGIVHSNLEDTNLCGYHIPKRSIIFPNIWALHMDKKFWKDPHTFRPQRFLDLNNKVRKVKNFLPFSLGRRACPGEALAKMELILFITCLLQEFNLHCETTEAVISGKRQPIAPPMYKLTATTRFV